MPVMRETGVPDIALVGSDLGTAAHPDCVAGLPLRNSVHDPAPSNDNFGSLAATSIRSLAGRASRYG
jgi:hypothetical protein